ncbi:MAG: SCP2 sterol-binding domain-containing protein [Acidimicrobiaceae bacterium]|nr:SCP2 sterol-binding domain-containing protein [Acidimicrobiaceae bacterium]
MSEVASAQWIEERQRQAAELRVAPDLTLTIEHRISGADEDAWHVVIDRGRIAFGAGPHPNPTLTLTGSRSTTDAIRSGEKSAQRAFLDGELQVGGNMATLLDNHIRLEKVAAILAATI